MSRPITDGPEPQYEKVVSGYETFHHHERFLCDWGGELPEFSLAYETWGKLSAARDNAVMLHTGLSSSSHAHSQPNNTHDGWWEAFIGPGKPIDTDRFFVICSNLLGGCYGSTGPAATNPKTNEPYATDFPILTVNDMVRAQLLLLDHLGIARLHASVGSSLGGMQSLQLPAIAPERVDRIVSISAAARSYPQSIAMRFVQRQAVMLDPDWQGGRYYGSSFPHRGQKVAREIGTTTYRSGPEWQERFGRERIGDGVPTLDEDFSVEGYLVHQGEKFCLQYDPNSYLYISKAMDLFDVTAPGPDGRPLIENVRAPALVIGVTSDILFPSWQQREVADLLAAQAVPTSFIEIDGHYGHDTFLIDLERVGEPLRAHLEAG